MMILRCSDCCILFPGERETKWEIAKPGEYWHTAQGYIGKCPHCKGYAREIMLEISFPKAGSESMDKMTFTVSEKEDTTMQVSCNGFTGELVKLEKKFDPCHRFIYDLSIYDREKQVTHSFTNVKPEDVKFIGGAVTFGG